MADTSYQHVVEAWVRENWLPAKFGQCFAPKSLVLRPGGTFAFDAVSADGRIVANISTSQERIASGRHGVGKVMKIRSDMFFLLMADCTSRLVVLTERDMFGWWTREVRRGRVPSEIKFEHATLPAAMAEELQRSRSRASDEVRARAAG